MPLNDSANEEGSSPTKFLIQNARIIDGTGSPSFLSSVLVEGDTIVSISSDQGNPEGVQIIDGCDGKLCLCPGFIDMHAHSDLSLLHTPSHEAKITQGVTSEVIGQDGIGYAPVDDECLKGIRRQIAGWNGNPSDEEHPGFFSWRTVREYLDTLDSRRIATNAAFLVPQGNLRLLVVGPEDRPATADEIGKMQALLAQAMEEGAVGMSSGLTYTPGMYASFDELAALCEVVKRYGGYYCPHTRSYGKGALEAYKEMIDLARKTGVSLHLTHAKLNFSVNKGRAHELLRMVDNALVEGLDVSLDSYPYTPGSTTLAALLPSWAASGGVDRTLERLSSPEDLERIRQDVETKGSDGCHGVPIEWDAIGISGTTNPSLHEYVGKTLQAISESESRPPFEVFIDILRTDNLATTILTHIGHEGNVRTIMKHPAHSGGSDSILTSSRPHPRGWGTFPRFLGHYARDLPNGHTEPSEPPEQIFAGGLEECINHLTGRAAKRLRLRDRGLVREGFKADLVLFEPDTIKDEATFEDPKKPATGVRYVFVNGKVALGDCKPTGGRFGKTLRWRHADDSKAGEMVVF